MAQRLSYSILVHIADSLVKLEQQTMVSFFANGKPSRLSYVPQITFYTAFRNYETSFITLFQYISTRKIAIVGAVNLHAKLVEAINICRGVKYILEEKMSHDGVTLLTISPKLVDILEYKREKLHALTLDMKHEVELRRDKEQLNLNEKLRLFPVTAGTPELDNADNSIEAEEEDDKADKKVTYKGGDLQTTLKYLAEVAEKAQRIKERQEAREKKEREARDRELLGTPLKEDETDETSLSKLKEERIITDLALKPSKVLELTKQLGGLKTKSFIEVSATIVAQLGYPTDIRKLKRAKVDCTVMPSQQLAKSKVVNDYGDNFAIFSNQRLVAFPSDELQIDKIGELTAYKRKKPKILRRFEGLTADKLLGKIGYGRLYISVLPQQEDAPLPLLKTKGVKAQFLWIMDRETWGKLSPIKVKSASIHLG